MRKMKIAFFIEDITKGAGTERCTVVLANLLNRLVIDVSILSINSSEENSRYEISSGVKVKTFNSQKIQNSLNRRMKTFVSLKHEITGGGTT